MQKAKSKAKPTPFERYLLEGEHVIWRGRPSTWDLLSRQDIVFVPMSLIFGFMASYLGWMVLQGNPSIINGLWGLPPLIVAQYFIWGRFLVKYWMRRNTRFAISNKRIFILNKVWGENGLTTYAISRLNTLVLGSRAIFFAKPAGILEEGKFYEWHWQSDKDNGLYGLSDAEHVFGILQSIIHEKQKR
ncbi:MAG: hypothetical protein AAFN11_00600 [Chloroflexota bacterium]